MLYCKDVRKRTKEKEKPEIEVVFKERKRENPRGDKEKKNFFGRAGKDLICTVIEIRLWPDVF